MTHWGTLRVLMADYRPTRRWHYHDATDRQLEFLKGFNVPVTQWLTKGEASHLIGKIQQRLPPTQAQQCFLRKRGLWHYHLTKTEASQIIGHIVGQSEPAES